MRTALLGIALGIGLFVAGAAAQHDEHHQDKAVPPAQEKKADASKAGGMSRMPEMMVKRQQETAKLVDELVKSLAAIESEHDQAKLKAKLAAHGALLKELQAKVQSESHRMEMMHQKMMGGSNSDKADNK